MSGAPLDVWVVDDDDAVRWVLDKALKAAGISTRSFERAEEFFAALGEARPDVVVTDVRMPGVDGMDLMRRLDASGLSLPVIVITAHTDLDSAVAAYRGGAFEYLPKPFDVDEAVSLVWRAARSVNHAALTESAEGPVMPQMIGKAPAMQEVFRTIGRLSRSSMNVLITGESGTGKELVARALHQHSPRSARPFVALNTTAIASELLESSCSATSVVPSPAPTRVASAASSRPTPARCSSTRSATCPPRCRHGCSAFWRRGSSIVSVGNSHCALTCASSPPPIRT